jgi:phosphoenolpyruvate carboxykinase (GTP)
VFERVTGGGAAIETPIGNLPAPGALDTKGLELSKEAFDILLKVDTEGWLAELPLIKKHYESFGDRLPAGLTKELTELEKRLVAAGV